MWMIAPLHPHPTDLSLHHVLAALGDPIRLRIARALADEEHGLNCTMVTAPFDHIAKSTLSGHFRVLRESGVICQRKRGVETINTLRRDDLDARFPGLLDTILALAPA